MKRTTVLCFLIAYLQIVTCWVAVISRSLASHGHAASQRDHYPPIFSSGSLDLEQGNGEGSRREMMSRLGSKPPSCEHKCGGCSPCYAIQMPTTTDRIGLQYSNYEPEGWKCKCGPTFFSP